jgi:uncharacterized protein
MKACFEVVTFKKPQDINVIIGQSHFIKTVEDIYETLVEGVPAIKFGLAFCEASGKSLIRTEGTDQELIDIAAQNAMSIGCGHMFVIVLGNAYPVNVLNRIKNISEVCQIFCASANPLQVIVAQTEQGKACIGVVDGSSPKGIETKQDKDERKELLRKFGYKL